MENECSIVRDLLPLYAENMVSSGTAAFVEEHLKGCAACREAYAQTQAPKPAPQFSDGAAPLQTLGRKLKAKRRQTIALTAVFVAALLVSAFAVLGAPIYLPYSEGLVTLEACGGQGVLLQFDETVTGFHYRVHDGLDGGDTCCCDIEAWTTLWDQWFSREHERQSAMIAPEDRPMLIAYAPNDGSESVCLARYDPCAEPPLETDVDAVHAVVLPRLALNYYLILAAAALAVIAAVGVLARKNAKARTWAERIGLYPAAYILSHCIVTGANGASYSAARDFSLIVLISLLLYGGLLLAHNIWRVKREIKEIHG